MGEEILFQNVFVFVCRTKKLSWRILGIYLLFTGLLNLYVGNL